MHTQCRSGCIENVFIKNGEKKNALNIVTMLQDAYITRYIDTGIKCNMCV